MSARVVWQEHETDPDGYVSGCGAYVMVEDPEEGGLVVRMTIAPFLPLGTVLNAHQATQLVRAHMEEAA